MAQATNPTNPNAYNRTVWWDRLNDDGTVTRRMVRYRVKLDLAQLRQMAIRAGKNTTHKCTRGPITVYGEEFDPTPTCPADECRPDENGYCMFCGN